MFNKILLAATPQIDTQTAPKAAFDLARSRNAEVILFHTLPLDRDNWCSLDDPAMREELLASTKAKIAAYFEKDLEGIRHSIRVTTGVAHEQMLRIIHDERVDLIVMGHHTSPEPRGNRMWGLVDTSIRKVCANVFCPVMVVTNPMPAGADIKRIIMATDFSTPSDSALCYAVHMAAAFNAHLDIFHVLDVGQTKPNPEYYMQSMDVFIDKALNRMRCRYAKALDGISHEFHCWEGLPYVEILKHARQENADMIIMAQYSSSEDHAKPSVGSTTIQVALSPGCPAVLVNYRVRTCI